MREYSKLLLLIAIFSILFAFESVAHQFYFRHYKTENGLSANYVRDIIQTEQGYMWFATTDGLNRFDGKNFKIFRNEKYDTLGNFITCVREDTLNNIICGTTSGVLFFDQEQEEFTPFSLKADNKTSIKTFVTSIIRTVTGDYWIATRGQGLFIYSPKNNTLKNINKGFSDSFNYKGFASNELSCCVLPFKSDCFKLDKSY